MVAGQSCIAGPSVYSTLCRTRLLGGPHFLCNRIGNKKRRLQPLPAGGECLKVPAPGRAYRPVRQVRHGCACRLRRCSCQATCQAIICESRTESKPFFAFKGLRPIYVLHAVVLCATNP
jgi:hypothetical protein